MIRRYFRVLLLSVAFCLFGHTSNSHAQSEVILLAEADEGMIDGGSIQQIEGFTFYEIQESGFLAWPFDIASEGTYSLVLNTRLSSGTKGQHISLNGKRFSNQAFPEDEAFIFDANVLGMNWAAYRIDPDSIHVPTDTSFAGPEILTLETGSHTLRIESAEGFQQFSGFSILDTATGDTAATVSAPDALTDEAIPMCDASAFCPTGFKSVALREGAFLSFNLLFPETGNYQVRIFYYAPNGGASDLLLDWNVVSGDISYIREEGELLSDIFNTTAGNHTLTIDTERGGFNVDYLELIKVTDSTSTANEENPYEEGFSLTQNYPNPFGSSTTVTYTLGSPAYVQLSVFDVLGREVQVLANTNQPTGTYSITWDGRDTNGRTLASGMYFLRLETNLGIETRRMIYMPE